MHWLVTMLQYCPMDRLEVARPTQCEVHQALWWRVSLLAHSEESFHVSFRCCFSRLKINYVETLSTLRFGQRIRSIHNKPVINEITEEDMDDLTDQICQLKDEFVRAKVNVSSAGPGNEKLTGRSIRGSGNQLRISLNRSLILPFISNDIEEDIHADESDVTELCKHLNILHASCKENPMNHSCDSDSMNFASVRGSCDSFFTSEHEINCLHESLQRKNVVNSSSLLGDDQQNIVVGSTKSLRSSITESEPLRSSLRSSKLFSGPPESLAASLKRGLEIIDSHQQISPSNKDSFAFSFEHLMLKPSPAADKINASVQTSSEARSSLNVLPSSFICMSCCQKGENASNNVEVEESHNNEGGGIDVAETSVMAVQLEKVWDEQAAKEELNRLVEQLKTDKDKDFLSRNCQTTEVKGCGTGENMETEIIKETCAIGNNKNDDESLDMGEKEELIAEIKFLKSKLQVYTDSSAPNKSIDKPRIFITVTLDANT